MTSTTLEKSGGGDLAAAGETAEARRLNALYKQCAQLAKSELVPKTLKGKPDNVFALALYGERFGLSPIHAIQRIYIIQGTFEPKAEVLAGVIIRAGHELRWDEVTPDRCRVSIRRQGTDYWQSTSWTIEQAKKAGLLDMWVERKVTKPGDQYPTTDVFVVGDDDGIFTAEERQRRGLGPVPEWAQTAIDAGNVKRKDPWFQFPDDMLAAKALRRGGKRIAPDALLGLHDEADPFEPLTPEKVIARRDDEPAAGHGPDDDPAAEPAPHPQPDVEEEVTDAEIIPDDESLPAAAEDDHPDDVPPPDDDEPQLDPTAARAAAMKRLMVTCTKAFPEADAPKGTKTHRQKLLRRAAQYIVLREHRSAADLTTGELEQVESWIHRHLISDSAVTPMRYEILDDDVVRFTLGEKSVEVSAPEQTEAA